MIARIGGDEFVIVMPNTDELQAEEIISKIHKQSKKISIESIELSISFGIKTKKNKEQDIQEIYRSAEDLMYREKLLEIPSMRSGAIETILNTLYEKDKKSELHSRTVSLISEKLAKANGMSRQDIAETKTAGLLHDIGKIIISSSIINKEGKLTSVEYNTMKNHPEIGFRILNSTSDMRSISNIVLSHHERWDGKGYPRSIKGEDIPIKARIITIADAYDAMTSERTYRDIFSKEEALKEIILHSGSQFDPKLVEVFKENFDTIVNDL
jgi:putative nucleotidyltransferase with HDIG domain